MLRILCFEFKSYRPEVTSPTLNDLTREERNRQNLTKSTERKKVVDTVDNFVSHFNSGEILGHQLQCKISLQLSLSTLLV